MKLEDIRAELGYSDRKRFITLEELRIAFGNKQTRSVKQYVDGLEAVNGKYYLIIEVANNIKQKCAG